MDEGKWDLSLIDKEELKKSQATLVYGQMNEPPGAVSYTHLLLEENWQYSKA